MTYDWLGLLSIQLNHPINQMNFVAMLRSIKFVSISCSYQSVSEMAQLFASFSSAFLMIICFPFDIFVYIFIFLRFVQIQ